MGPIEGWANVGLVIAPDVIHAPSLTDTLRTTGLIFHKYSTERLMDAVATSHVLILVHSAELTRNAPLFEKHLRDGGAIVCLGGTCGLEGWLGVRNSERYREFGEGYLRPSADHPISDRELLPIHCFGGMAVEAADATALADLLDRHGRHTGLCGATVREFDRSTAILLAPDLGATAVRLRQGSYIEMDGLPAPDGTAPVRDGILRSEDGMVLDWDFDRVDDIPPEPPAFVHPPVDRLVEWLIRSIAYAAERMGLPIAFLWPHRYGAVATGIISVATDGTDPQNIQTILHQANLVGLHATWCMRSPGFSLDVVKALRVREHEVALQFELSEPEDWSSDRLGFQQTRMSRAAGVRQLASVGIRGGRWQGRNEFWEWCGKHGIEVEIGRTPCYAGNAGCLFGTFRPFRPAKPDGSLISVLSIPSLALDPGHHVSSARVLNLVDHTVRRHGFAHFTFESSSFSETRVSECFRNLVAHGKSQGLTWATAEDVSLRMKAVRTARVDLGRQDENTLIVAIHPEYDMPDAALCVTGDSIVGVNSLNKRLRVSRATRFGLPCTSVVFDLVGQCPTYLTLELARPAQRAG